MRGLMRGSQDLASLPSSLQYGNKFQCLASTRCKSGAMREPGRGKLCSGEQARGDACSIGDVILHLPTCSSMNTWEGSSVQLTCGWWQWHLCFQGPARGIGDQTD